MKQKIRNLITFGAIGSLVFMGCRKQGEVITEAGEARLALLLKEKVASPVAAEESKETTEPAKEAPAVGVAKEVLDKAIADGKTAYVTCAACHQATGAGIPGAFPPLVKSNWVNDLSNSELAKVVLFGLQGEIEVNAQKYASVMAPLGAMLTDQQIADVLTYVKNEWGNTGGYISPAEVKAVRDANPGQGMLKQADFKTLKPSAKVQENPSLKAVTEKPADQAEVIPDSDNMKWLAEQIHAKIVQTSKKVEAKDMQPYEQTVPLADDARFKMVVIPGGTFKMGSPETEAGRGSDEGPQREVTVDPFWMGEVEVTWQLYRNFYDNGAARSKNGMLSSWNKSKPLTDLLTQPTTQYYDMFINGLHASEDSYPAMNMTLHAANKFCEWLSAQTGHYYRLPTEAEWEFAAKGSSSTTFPWGDDSKLADDYAWHKGNSNLTYNEVKLKKPNGYGLYDMIGNVAELTLDMYDDKGHVGIKDGEKNPMILPTKRYPTVIKGGSFESDHDKLRVAARKGSDMLLKEKDPQMPNSVWYFTNGQHIGFRVVRPLTLPSVEDVHKIWNVDYFGSIRNLEDVDK
jgi:formylglycine-generating enzyme required for sulfatase activity/mono/diheme cytochrome c family protein